MVVKPSSFPLEMKNLRGITNSPDKRPPSHCLDVVITKFVLDHSFPLQLLLPIFKNDIFLQVLVLGQKAFLKVFYI